MTDWVNILMNRLSWNYPEPVKIGTQGQACSEALGISLKRSTYYPANSFGIEDFCGLFMCFTQGQAWTLSSSGMGNEGQFTTAAICQDT